MATNGSGDAAPTDPPRRAPGRLFLIAIVLLLIGTVVGVVLARSTATDQAERDAEEAATDAATAIESEFDRLLAALDGAQALVGSDGLIAGGSFDAFADDLLAGADVSGVVLVDVPSQGVDDAVPGFTITRIRPGPVEQTAPSELGRIPALERGVAAAVRSRAPTVVGPTDLVSADGVGFVVLRPLPDPATAEIRLLIGVEHPAGALAATVRDAAGREVVVNATGDTLLGTAFEPRATTIVARAEVPNDRWDVAVLRGGPQLRWVVVIAGAGAAIVLGVIGLALVTRRQQRLLAHANARLTESERRTQAVQDLTGRLARALSGDDVATALLDHLPGAVGARTAVLATTTPTGDLEIVGREQVLHTPTDRLAVDDERSGVSIVGTTLATGEPAWLSSPLHWRDDETTSLLAGDGSAIAVLPLVATGISGILAVSYPRVRIFSPEERDLLQTVSVLAARALARGRRYDTEHRAAVAFQHAALPDEVPRVDGMTVAARYRPATHQATVGGDWYDVLVIDERHVLCVVGDVVGHGMVAAATMGRLRAAFQAFATVHRDPGVILQAMSRQAATVPNVFCTTMICALLDLDAGTMTWCRAGHPPPLLVGPAGARLLDEPGLPPLGFAPEASPRVHTCSLATGDVVVLYTDGVIERRGESIAIGFERLGIVTADLIDLEPEELSDALIEALVPVDEQVDDLATLVIRFDGRSVLA